MSIYRRKTEQDTLAEIIKIALLEDCGIDGDITSNAIISPNLTTKFVIAAREDIIICGADIPELIFKQYDPKMHIERFFQDGDVVPAGAAIIQGSGNAISILSLERTILNLLQHLCGIASNTRKFVNLIKHTKAIIRDTRKTLPGLRELEKYAVRIGGGENHRFTLDESFLIKDNHIALCNGNIRQAFELCKEKYPNKLIEIECDTIEQVELALLTGCDLILLDNMSIDTTKKAVALVNNKIKLEASGGINLSNVQSVAETGVDYVAIGSLTHSVKASDIGLDIIEIN